MTVLCTIQRPAAEHRVDLASNNGEDAANVDNSLAKRERIRDTSKPCVCPLELQSGGTRRCLQSRRTQPNRVRSERKQPCGVGVRVRAETAFCSLDLLEISGSVCRRNLAGKKKRPKGPENGLDSLGNTRYFSDLPSTFLCSSVGRAGGC